MYNNSRYPDVCIMGTPLAAPVRSELQLKSPAAMRQVYLEPGQLLLQEQWEDKRGT